MKSGQQRKGLHSEKANLDAEEETGININNLIGPRNNFISAAPANESKKTTMEEFSQAV